MARKSKTFRSKTHRGLSGYHRAKHKKIAMDELEAIKNEEFELTRLIEPEYYNSILNL